MEYWNIGNTPVGLKFISPTSVRHYPIPINFLDSLTAS
jgi:hypothetical protein